ncbi:glycosyltransferase family 2 protein [uncultured Paraglaciecola sp.]|uniref:glycosyltransferase family 2 protein n=1 Tax=uncultured Paraglaciecola sp. TaxID=1765024 RepID=UPI00259931F0|nr:glycosyltransferase family 2 protein [uncultured Paraglaciecola sp.]
MQKLKSIVMHWKSRFSNSAVSLSKPKRTKIKLVAIAKDEAAYFPEWIHHHLYFGFDEIEIYINRTSDNSEEILEHIHVSYPQVKWRSADWIDKCPQDAKKQIQFIVYNKVWDETLSENNFDYILFLDIDEFWIPQSFNQSIHDFMDKFASEDVVSFEWLNDLGNLKPLSSLPKIIEGNLSPLVKTIYPVDTKIKELRHHVPLFEGKHNHVLADKEPFTSRPSLIQAVSEEQQSFKDAFIYHRAHRSIEEYISLLYRGRPGDSFPYKTNRYGLPITEKHYNKLHIPDREYNEYSNSYISFIEQQKLVSLKEEAEEFVWHRFKQSMCKLKEFVDKDYSLMMQMFRGVYQHEVAAIFAEKRIEMIKQQPDDFRLIRDLAIDAATQNIDEAISLMTQAQCLNPDGPVINQKLIEFKKISASRLVN